MTGGCRVVLGTAQLGMPYGIKNKTQQRPSLDVVREIVKAAWMGGIDEFDTAQNYGESEVVLGDAFNALGIANKVRVISKISPAVAASGPVALERALKHSLDCLQVGALYGLMLHSEAQIALWHEGLGRWLSIQRQNKLIKKIGVSVYSPAKALEALDLAGVDFIQIPSNIVDLRFEDAGVFQKARGLGKRVYIRSVFLQGALLMSSGALPEYVSFLRGVVNKVRSLAERLDMAVADMCFAYVMQKWPEAKVIFGAESSEQVQSNLRTAAQLFSPLPLECIEQELGPQEEFVVNPSLWPKAP